MALIDKRMAATHYWNTGDAKAAAPFVKALCEAAPERLDLFLWHIDALVRLGRENEIRETFKEPVEDRLEGRPVERARLASALAHFGQPERALRLSYRDFVLNRNNSSAWMGFMSVMLSGGKSDDDDLLSTVIGGDHSFEVRCADGTERRYLIESDDAVRNVEPDALPPDHEIALAVRGRQPGDRVSWPDGAIVEILSAKHKYLDAFHAALARFNERFPAARGFKQVKVTTEGENAYGELKAQLVTRSNYVAEQTKIYAEGKLSLSMLAFMTGVDTIDVMMGLSEVGSPYRVAIGIEQERKNAFEAIDANGKRGCVVDAATYHCIRRLGLDETVTAICGKLAITQATADLYRMRLQNTDLLGSGEAGSMGYRDGQYYLVKRTLEERQKTRETIQSDIQWLTDNAEILPARPMNDPPPILRRLSVVKNARFFDDVFAANGAERLLLVDDLFTRQVAAQLGTPATSLQRVLMVARSRGLLSHK